MGIWLSEMHDVESLPMNDVFELNGHNSQQKLKPEDTLLFHAAKTVKIAKEKYSDCQKLRV